MSKVFDLFIIGGGINGAGLARDAAGRGLSVCLADKGEIGGATSSWSTKLIHGGLRYLENYEFKLVRESLKERETIYKIAKPISKPIPFIITYVDKIRPAWLIKMRIFLYDKKLTKQNIKSAKKYKAKILEYNKVKKAEINGNEWVIHLQKGERIKSKILINASGPWIN